MAGITRGRGAAFVVGITRGRGAALVAGITRGLSPTPELEVAAAFVFALLPGEAFGRTTNLVAGITGLDVAGALAALAAFAGAVGALADGAVAFGEAGAGGGVLSFCAEHASHVVRPMDSASAAPRKTTERESEVDMFILVARARESVGQSALASKTPGPSAGGSRR